MSVSVQRSSPELKHSKRNPIIIWCFNIAHALFVYLSETYNFEQS